MLWMMSLSDLIGEWGTEGGKRGNRERCGLDAVGERVKRAVARRRTAAEMIICVRIEIINHGASISLMLTTKAH